MKQQKTPPKIYEPPEEQSLPKDIFISGIEEYIRIKMSIAYMEGVNRGALFVIETDRFPDNKEKDQIKQEFERRL